MTTNLTGQAVQVIEGGRVVVWGTAEYVTADGWVGIRQAHEGGRVDEFQATRVQPDPT